MERFLLRRALERLRDGLLDAVAVNRLTMESDRIVKNFAKGLGSLACGLPAHLCLCGSYGQGKSHNLNYLYQHALAQGYAVSLVQLDIREIPFHQFHIVYRAVMEKLSLPNGEAFIESWKKFSSDDLSTLLHSLPHRFQFLLKALGSKNRLLQDPALRPVAHVLEMALMGYEVPLPHLKRIFRFLSIEGFDREPLQCKGNLPYVQMLQALGRLLKAMGHKGLVLFFDEAEAIAQGRSRAKSYEILQQFFSSQEPIYPIFAFTESFFDKVNQEDYGSEKQIFPQNYAQAWKDLNVVYLEDSSPEAWRTLQERLIQLYAEAYQVDFGPQTQQVQAKLQQQLDTFKTQETRFKLKALVHQLDIEAQQQKHILDVLGR